MHGSDERHGEQGRGNHDDDGLTGRTPPERGAPEEVGQARRSGGPRHPHHRAVDQAEVIDDVHRR